MELIGGDLNGYIDESTSPIFTKIIALIKKLDYEENALQHWAQIDGTMSKFSDGIALYPPPKYIPNLPPRNSDF